MIHDKLYHKDSLGNIRVWWMEQDGNKYRSHSGILDGAIVTTEWTTALAMNVGRANATTPEQQAALEVESKYTKKLRVSYHRDINDVDTPVIFTPMTAKKYEDRKAKLWGGEQTVYVQPKYDGIRCVAKADGLWTRTGKVINSCPHIEQALKPLFEADPDLVLDGEIYNHIFKDHFNAIISIVRKTKHTDETLAKSEQYLRLYLYDIGSSDDNYGDRYNQLKQLVESLQSDYLVVSTTTAVSSEDQCDQLHADNIQEGYEGSIIRLDEKYENKRTNSLLKRKDFQDEEFEIVDILEGRGNGEGLARSVVVINNDGSGKQFEAGVIGDNDYAADILANKDKYIGKQATIKFFGRSTDENIPRHGKCKMLYSGEKI